ncbi:MAG: DinB family protein [Anaerolineales bacterium]
MSDHAISKLEDLILSIETSWAALVSFVDGLTEKQASMRDDRGWTVQDHMTHMAVWEDSVAILFRGKPRHEALGVDEAFYADASFDEINEVIRKRTQSQRPSQALETWTSMHQEFMARIRSLSEADLSRRVHDFFPLAPRSDDRLVIDFLHENTAAHIDEHLPWMRAIVGRRH